MLGIDPRSIVLLAAVMALLMSLVLFVLHRNYPPTIRGLREWATGPFLSFVSTLLFGASGFLPDFVSGVIGNLLLLSSPALMVIGSQRFYGQPPSLRLVGGLLLASAPLFYWFTLVHPSYVGRMVVFTGLMAWFLVRSARLLFKHGAHHLFARLTGGVLLLQTGLLLLRMVAVLLDGDAKGVFDASPIHVIYIVGYALFALLVSIGEVLMAAERVRDEFALSHQRLREAEMRQTISDERQRLMQDMHDGLGSSLISAIRSVEHGGVSDVKVSQILKDCLDDLKLTIDSMEPVEADLLLLLATLRFRLEPRLEGTGIALLWKVQELPTLTWLDPSSALHILRIVQESVANILRHTRATEIRVATAVVTGGVQVTIEDNGQGFDVDKALGATAGRGLHNQQRRALAIEGTVGWKSGPNGTQFRLWLPLERSPRSF
ncbi:signal transduction histidine kinase [Rhodoferax saidenbachensis]|uniref:Signal transduction histidine kinase n=1 Tax=Rhodoferax saidenbachensis TaxID=1484693 RepID=A0ABU1ZTD6_9BURK|nr:signal transduction histidine kinase [Rhodoferax saidenbachensis]